MNRLRPLSRQRPLVTSRPTRAYRRLVMECFYLPEAEAEWIAYRMYWPRCVTLDRRIEIVHADWYGTAELVCNFPPCQAADLNWETAEAIADEYRKQARRRKMYEITVEMQGYAYVIDYMDEAMNHDAKD